MEAFVQFKNHYVCECCKSSWKLLAESEKIALCPRCHNKQKPFKSEILRIFLESCLIGEDTMYPDAVIAWMEDRIMQEIQSYMDQHKGFTFEKADFLKFSRLELCFLKLVEKNRIQLAVCSIDSTYYCYLDNHNVISIYDLILILKRIREQSGHS